MSAFTPGPWKWFGNTKNHEIHLATENRGRIFVMQFARWGMRGAQPRFQVDQRMRNASELVRHEVCYRADIAEIEHPDAHLIAAAPALYDALAFVMVNSGDPVMERVAAAALAKADGR